MKRLLLPLLAALALPNAVNANVDPKVAEICMKAVDFQGCVKAMGGEKNEPVKTTVVSNKQNDLLLEIKKLPSRIQNTSLRDYTSRTLSFSDALAVSTPEEVGENLYLNAKKLSLALDILYETWNRKVDIGTDYVWDPKLNFAAKNSLDRIFGGNTIEIRCNKRWFGILGGGNRKIGEDILNPVARVVAYAAQQINSPEDVFAFPSNQEQPFIRSYASDFCPGDPNAPVEEKKKKKKTVRTEASTGSVKINCNSPVWRDKPRCN